jgi:CspA family cold shock protein
MEGTFKWYNSQKGYGFITGEDSKDYFVHHSALPEGQENIREEDKIKVTFEVKETQRGTQAQDIVFVKDDEE